jgi:hypothetical protein
MAGIKIINLGCYKPAPDGPVWKICPVWFGVANLLVWKVKPRSAHEGNLWKITQKMEQAALPFFKLKLIKYYRFKSSVLHIKDKCSN